MDIRPLRLPEDVEALASLDPGSSSDTVLEVTTSEQGFVISEVPVDSPVTKRHEFVSDLSDPDRMWTDAYVALEGQTAVGFASTVYHPWNRRQVLWQLYVDRRQRGRGVGRRPTDVIEECALVNGARQLWLETQNTNVPAVRAYRAMGFQLVGLDRTLYDGDVSNETALYFARTLAPA